MKTYQPAHYVVDEFTTESELMERCENARSLEEALLLSDKIWAMCDVDIAISKMMRS